MNQLTSSKIQIKEEILSKHAELDRREKVRKLREMKKIGKQMQQESLRRKNAEKKNFNKSIEKIKKGDKDGFEVLAVDNDDKKPKKERKAKTGFRSEAHEKKDVKYVGPWLRQLRMTQRSKTLWQ